MARLFSSGAELQSVSNGVEWDIGAGSISTSIFRSGSASLRTNISASTGFIQHQVRSSSSNPIFLRTFLYIGTAPDANTTIMGITNTAVNNQGGGIVLNTDRTLSLIGGAGTGYATIGSPSAVLSTGTWYRIEMSYDDSSVNNTLVARLNGTQFATGNGEDMSGTAVNFILGVIDTATADLNFDDMAINDNQGTSQTSWPGDGKIVHLKPNTTGDANSFATQTGGTSGSAFNFTRISETTPDDTTTFNGSSTLNEEDLTKVGGVPTVNLTSGSATGSITSQATASITPTANRLVLLSVTSRTNASVQPNAPTATGNGLTWVQVASIYWDTAGASRRSTTVLRAMGSSPSTGAITIDFAAQTQTDVIWSVDEFPTVDTSGTNGSGAVVQSATNKDETGSATTITATLGAFGNVNNATFGVFATDGNDTFTAGTGFTLINQVQSNSVLKQAIEFKSFNDTSVDISTAVGGGLGAIGIEIKAASPSTTAGIGASDTINLVSVGGRFRNSTADTTGAFKFEIEKAAAGTISQSSAIIPNSTTWKTNALVAPFAYPITLYQDPDASAWTTSTLDSAQIGYKDTAAPGTAGRRNDISTAWMLVDFTPATVSTVKTLAALGVG